LPSVRLSSVAVVCAAVRERLRARAVTMGDHAVERQVLDRMVLGVDREPPLSGLEGRAIRDGPRRENAAHLEPDIPVKPRRVVPMHDVAARLLALRLFAFGFRSTPEVAFALVLGEAQSVAFAIVGEVAS